VKIALFLALGLWAIGPQQVAPAGAPADLATARSLYAAGNYEDALSHLAAAWSDANAGEIIEYRALCQLALGRTDDAQRSLDDLVTHQPLFRMSEADVSPRLVTLFRDTRKRLLPSVARDLYARGKGEYQDQHYAEAKATFADIYHTTS